MAEARDFNRVLDDCLDRLLLRGETVESCLARYPQQTAELEPLLRAMLQTQEALARLPQPARFTLALDALSQFPHVPWLVKCRKNRSFRKKVMKRAHHAFRAAIIREPVCH